MLSSANPVCHEFSPTVPHETFVYLAFAKIDLDSGKGLLSLILQLLVVGQKIAFTSMATSFRGYPFGIFPLT